MEFVKTYTKSLLAVLATILVALTSVLSGGVTPNEWVTVAIAGAGAVAVFTAPNVPGARYTKAILAVVTTVLAFLSTLVLTNGLGGADLLNIVIIALGALGVTAFPNSKNGVNLSDTGSVGVDGTEGP